MELIIIAGSISKEKAAKTLLESTGVRGESEITVYRQARNYHHFKHTAEFTHP